MSILTGNNPFQDCLEDDLFEKDKRIMFTILNKFDRLSENASKEDVDMLYKEWSKLDEEFLKDLEQWKKDGSIS